MLFIVIEWRRDDGWAMGLWPQCSMGHSAELVGLGRP